jgi:hypothetical protein
MSIACSKLVKRGYQRLVLASFYDKEISHQFTWMAMPRQESDLKKVLS